MSFAAQSSSIASRDVDRAELLLALEAKWSDALIAARLLAIDPRGLKGVCVKAGAGPVRDLWLRYCSALAAPSGPVRKLPVTIDDHSLYGGLDLTATLAAGKPMASAGLLEGVHGGLLVAPMAERMTSATAAALSTALDHGMVRAERDGLSIVEPSEFVCVLFDESVDAHEAPPEALMERLAFHVDLSAIPIALADDGDEFGADLERARGLLSSVNVSPTIVDAIANMADACGVPSTTTLFQLVRSTRAAAALSGRQEASAEDAAVAVRLVLASRAETSPMISEEEASPEPDQTDQEDNSGNKDDHHSDEVGRLEDTLIEAVRGADISHLLRNAALADRQRRQRKRQGKSGAASSGAKGRPRRSRPGDPRRDGRIDIGATLLAAAPWQKLRNRQSGAPIVVRRQDFRIRTHEQKSESVVIFVVDASGSAAMTRMAEAKGAVEMLLGDCYSRRDHVALITFRGDASELALPPTRSLVRARRLLVRLPGGGATPLASALVDAELLASTQSARGRTPFVVIMSDGRGNIARNGQADREQSETDTFDAAKRLRAGGYRILFFDTSRRPDERAAHLADALGASYQPLPIAGAAALSSSIKTVIRN